MNITLHSGASRLLTLICAMAIAGILPACTDDAERELPDKGKGGTATLELSLSVPPIVETKAVICESDSGSEARKAGFYYEMQVLTTDTAKTVATKAPSSLKNIYAFLFKSDGTFNGRASLETASTGSGVTLVFTDIANASAADGRLVIIANDAVGVDYTSSPTFASFSGNYTEFPNLTLTSSVTKDTDIPYVGSTTVTLLEGSFAATATVQLYRMLAQINLTNNTFSIEGGPSRNAINLYNAGNMYFGTPNNYNGTVNVSGTLERHLKLAATANSGVSVKSTAVHGGLNIGTLHGASSTKNQLLQPNTSGTTAVDKIRKTWSDAKVYCAQLQLDGVAAGSWYLPSKDQLKAIYKKKQEINGAYYSAFVADYYWSATENSASFAWYVYFHSGSTSTASKGNSRYVRCIRDL